MPEKKSQNFIVQVLATPFLILCGLFCLAGTLWPALRKGIDDTIGELNFIYIGLGFLFFYTAVLVAEKNLMREKFLGLMEEIMNFLTGKEGQQEGSAVDILIGALEKGDEKAARVAASELQRLTGQDFGTDHARWYAWWADNRERFLLSKIASPREKRESDGSSD